MVAGQRVSWMGLSRETQRRGGCEDVSLLLSALTRRRACRKSLELGAQLELHTSAGRSSQLSPDKCMGEKEKLALRPFFPGIGLQCRYIKDCLLLVR